MDVQRNTRERVFSILNDNDCPSFVIRQKQSSPSPPPARLPSISSLSAFSPRLERPNLLRHPHFERTRSVSSAGSPPLLRYDSASSSSSKSSSSMDSTPSPITPAYNLNDSSLLPYDNLLRQEMASNYLPSPTGITPFMEQSMMIGPVPQMGQEASYRKVIPPIAPAVYPGIPGPIDIAQLPTPALSTNASISSSVSSNQPQTKTSPTSGAGNNNASGKKNKYPCPYAQSHNCSATFTTSGHAARHGKKHTGEKGVHCPICDKAFTRKDNMKQHERTHKDHPQNTNGEEKKSKAQATREAQKTKAAKKEEGGKRTQPAQPDYPAHIRKSSSGISDPSEISLAPNHVETPVDISPTFFPDPNPQIVLPMDSTLLSDPTAASMYPPLVDDTLIPPGVLSQNEKLDISVPQPPTLVRGFSDLDTLAQAAAFDPYYQQGQF
ncbi:hypothetical protein H2198_002655 [Neophaeococcomyces mojaviensis]|uniref:Uncharacterized protein n=1 Tax=Neophaeococcomyces mojaviensis TaxID=3383035 RepID=A0ACC3ADP0_9EURO|nr:hypothetical protein H2198_002655 [Knufia sp. JES_112]